MEFRLERKSEKSFGAKAEVVYHYVSGDQRVAFCAHPTESFTWVTIDGDEKQVSELALAFTARVINRNRHGGFDKAIEVLTI